MPKYKAMAKEIERKFLVNDESYKERAIGSERISQGYISTDPDRTVRVRIKGEKAFITVKTRNEGCVRNEWEFPIPVADAAEMLDACCGNVLSKTRYYVPAGDGLTWEVDEFHNLGTPLTVAEIELPSADAAFELAPFIGREVTGDARYYNSSLSKGFSAG